MKITRIVQQAKQQSRYSIFVDGRYSFSLSDAGLLQSRLVVGQELSAVEVKHWQRESSDDKVAANALRYAALRLRSRWEMEQYLKRKGASPALAEKTLNKLSNISLLDDEKFAMTWVSNRRLLRPTSKRKLQQELRAKHIPDQVINITLSASRSDAEQTALQQIITKKRNLPKYQAEPLKLMQYLARQGFSYDDIKQALRADADD